MWIHWLNPKTGERERAFNHFDPDTETGEKAIRLARRCLAKRFAVPEDRVPGFRVEWAAQPPSRDGETPNE